MRVYYRKNSVVIEALKLTDQDGNVITDAAVSVTMTLEDGSAIEGLTNPIPLTHEGEGGYAGVVPPLDLADGTRISITVSASNGSAQGEWSRPSLIRNRPVDEKW